MLPSERDRLSQWVSDDPVQAVLATAAFARMQIASYEILRSVAELAGESSIAAFCEEHRTVQAEFADWLDKQMPELLGMCPSDTLSVKA